MAGIGFRADSPVFLLPCAPIMTPTFEIAILASGSGTNAQKVLEYFADRPQYSFTVYSPNPQAGVVARAQKLGIDTQVFGRKDMADGGFLAALQARDTQLVVLAGFLWLVPQPIVEAFPRRILNIHPSLLPKFGGKGMYGVHVHEAVLAAAETQSGITIHLIDQHYDRGEILAQHICAVHPGDTPDSLAARVQALEHEFFACTIEKYILDSF